MSTPRPKPDRLAVLAMRLSDEAEGCGQDEFAKLMFVIGTIRAADYGAGTQDATRAARMVLQPIFDAICGGEGFDDGADDDDDETWERGQRIN